MSREDRARQWLDAHRAMLDELRSAEIRLAVAADALHREASARHSDTTDLVQELASAAGELARRSADALELPDMPDLRSNLFFRAACRRWQGITEVLRATDEKPTPPELSAAAQEIRTGRTELDEAMQLLAKAARTRSAE